MADLARILALPAPRSFGPGTSPAGGLLRPIRSGRADEAAGNNLPTESVRLADAAEEATAQAKRFRFRVYDGASRDAQAGELQRDQASVAGNRPKVAAVARDQVNAGSAEADPAEPKAIATFLAQLIAQQQLGQGLHAPPVKAADLAYRRAGAEPRIDIGSSARFSLAV
jgi:hypothetical protein